MSGEREAQAAEQALARAAATSVSGSSSIR